MEIKKSVEYNISLSFEKQLRQYECEHNECTMNNLFYTLHWL